MFARPINTGGSEPQEFTKSLETLTRFLKELDKDDDESDSEASLEERVCCTHARARTAFP